jgi:hypothetical protein
VFTLKPVHREHCYWQQELDSAIKSIRSKKNLLILGPDKIGKSSFLLHIQKKIGSKSLTPAIFSADNCITLESYIKKNLLSLMKAYEDIFTRPKDLFSFPIIELDKKISALKLSENTKNALKLLLVFQNDPKTDIEDVVKTFFEFPSLLAKETKTTPIIMIDDAHHLQNLKADKISLSLFFDILPELKDTLFVITSHSLKLEGFEQVILSPFSIDATKEFLAGNNVKLDEQALNTLQNVVEGFPFYINFFGRQIACTGKTNDASLNELVSDSLSNELHMYFSEKLKLLSPKELPILFCMAQHNVNTPSRISRLINYSQTNIRRFLSIMEEKGFVSLKERGVFEINDPVFRRWLEIQSRS